MSGTPVLARILCNEILNFEIELALNGEKFIVPQLVVAEAAELVMSPQVGNMIWVIFDSSTKEVNKIYK